MAEIGKPQYPELLFWTLLEALAQVYIRDDLDYDQHVVEEFLNGIHILRKHIDV